jgi:hypothetical protein
LIGDLVEADSDTTTQLSESEVDPISQMIVQVRSFGKNGRQEYL